MGYTSVLLMLSPFSKSKKAVYRLPLGFYSPCQSLLGGSNPGVWVLLPSYHCVLALMLSLTAVDCLTKYIRLTPCFVGEGVLSAPQCA